MNPCADCIRTSATCSWERAFIPVPGWVAEETKIRYQGRFSGITFDIKFCPLFRKHPKAVKAVSNSPRPVIAINLVTGEQIFFPSVKRAVKDGGFLESCIYKCLCNDTASHYGHFFRYADEREVLDHGRACH